MPNSFPKMFLSTCTLVIALYPYQHLLLSLLSFSHSVECVMISHYDLFCISLIIKLSIFSFVYKWFGYLFYNVLFQIPCPIFFLSFFFPYWFEIILKDIINVSLLCLCVDNIFSYFVACPFILLMSFDDQKFFILM